MKTNDTVKKKITVIMTIINEVIDSKIPIIRPGHVFGQKVFLVGLFSRVLSGWGLFLDGILQ